jgi:two-component system sensor histidine kinase YesM
MPVKVYLSTKIIRLYLVIALVFVGASYIYYHYTSKYIEKEIGYYSDFITKQFCDNFQTTITNIQMDVFGKYNVNVLLSKNVSKKIASGANAYYKNTIRDLDIKNALDEILYLTTYINWVSVVDPHGNVYTSSKKYGGVNYDITKNMAKDLGETSAARGGTIWRRCGDGSIVLMRVIYDLSVMRYCGYAIIDIDQRTLSHLFQDINSWKIGDFVVIDSQNQPLVFSSAAILKIAKYYLATGNNADSKVKLKYAGNTYIYSMRKLDKSKLAIIHLTNVNDIKEKLTGISRNLIFICLICLVVVFAMIKLIFKGLARNLKRLIAGIDKVAKGDLSTKIDIQTSDEIGYISQNVNGMVEEIVGLLSRVASEKKAKQEANYQMLEFRYSALQEQVNPHFIFNVLESINGIAKLNNDQQVSELVCKLAKFLRGNIGRTQKYCDLKEEIEYIDNYLSIYKQMYQDKLIVNYELDESLNDFQVPTLILQPIVENAIVHGIEPKVDPGVITIASSRSDDHIILTVSDDGVGIPEAKLSEILSGQEAATSRKRVGIINVIERIKLLYGPDYGLMVSSEPGEYTSVAIILPGNGTLRQNTGATQ